VLGSSGAACAAVFPPGYSLDYKEFTSPVSVTATTEGTANTVITADSVAFDGAAVWIEFSSPAVQPAGGFTTSIVLRDDTAGTVLGRIAAVSGPAAVPAVIRRRLTPAAGARIYSVRAYTVGGTAIVGGGVGGSGADMPGYISITKA
jgi:hypothetical protein